MKFVLCLSYQQVFSGLYPIKYLNGKIVILSACMQTNKRNELGGWNLSRKDLYEKLYIYASNFEQNGLVVWGRGELWLSEAMQTFIIQDIVKRQKSYKEFCNFERCFIIIKETPNRAFIAAKFRLFFATSLKFNFEILEKRQKIV